MTATLERAAVRASGDTAVRTFPTPPAPRPREPRPAPRAATAERGIRAEIQGLRALAMALVVIYHVTPLRVPGGYVGVDVFFVVSGFLITGHLLREVERTGRIRLAQFWARRARRLLPAALLVLLTSAVATLLFVPTTLWTQFLREIGGSALYVENWILAGDAVDYLAAANVPSPAQHYWSLSTEEQFYLAWPLLVLAAAWLAARLPRGRRGVLAAVLGTVTVASFGYSLWATTSSVSTAYFATPARAWEFGAGALLALLATTTGRDGLRRVVSWAGFGAIAWAAFGFSHDTPFPGTAALLPVLGTVAVIWAGSPRGDWSPTRLAEFGPVRFLGDVSYSAYLWHWPLVVLLPFVLGHPLGTVSKVGIVVATVAAAWLTKVLVEDPVRTSALLTRRRTRVTYLATVLATGVVVAVAASGTHHVDVQVARASAAATGMVGTPCFGAAAMDPANDCAGPNRVTETVSPAFAESDRSEGMRCLLPEMSTEVRACPLPHPGSTEKVVLIGDSHAASWWEAVSGTAHERGWSVEAHLHAGCPALASDRFTGPGMPAGQPVICRDWSAAVIAEVAADPEVTRVFTTHRTDAFKFVDEDGQLRIRWSPSVVRAALQPLVDAGKEVYVIRAVPSTNGVTPDGVLADHAIDSPDCIATAAQDDDPCSGPRAHRLTPDSVAEGVAGMPGVQVIDLTDSFCDASRCHTVVGGVVVYWDSNHMSRTFSATLAEPLGAALDRMRG
ncbi:acyltransferase family protein [Geodermatophilus maliterrae]|uniref:Acyltransferase family protein n=1 Tax=Geodermatophilus maliterrae TaxID=3162531 RepID=A0ABV3XC75_9ACTN